MRIRIEFFASSRSIAGGGEVEREIPDGADLAAVRAALIEEYPGLAPLLDRSRLAVGDAYAEDSRILEDGDTVAVIPPVSGGSGRFDLRITGEKLDPGEAERFVSSDSVGAVVTFLGKVRDRNEGHEVLAIEYEAKEDLAFAEGIRIMEEVSREVEIEKAAVHHRTGRLEVGETSVVVAVSAEHRGEAFRGAERIMDEVKNRLPVWKLEERKEGKVWL